MEQVRLNKYLAQCGVCSRRAADQLIGQGKVTINGRIASMGDQVFPGDEVALEGKVLEGQKKPVVLAFYKPVGVVCTEKDAHAERILSDLIDYPARVTYAGRLDKDSEGLLLLTNDGDLIEAMMRGANRHEKEYIVKVHREVTPEFLRRLSRGVYLEELDCTTRPCRVEQTGKFTFRIVLTQGLNRQIRRMCETFGYYVRKIQRIRVMNITLDGIPYGGWREVTGEELERLYQEAGLGAGDEKSLRPVGDWRPSHPVGGGKPSRSAGDEKSSRPAARADRPHRVYISTGNLDAVRKPKHASVSERKASEAESADTLKNPQKE